MKKLLTLVAIGALSAPLAAQIPLTTPRVSQKASVMQRVGLTDITVEYHRPGVNGRDVWGGLVPLDQVWRAGANENTTVTFSTPVSVEGELVPAGTYGLHMIPSEGDWTVILSSVASAWGSFSYDQSEDVARVMVSPEEHAATERLTYSFDQPEASSVELALTWADKRIPIYLEVDLADTLVASAADELRGLPRFGWQGWNQGAGIAVQVGNLDQATEWVDRSISMNRNFSNLQTKIQILQAQGESADDLIAEGIEIANENELNAWGYTLFYGQSDIDGAIEVFTLNTERHPDSWNVWDSLAEALAAKGETEASIANYTKALEMTTLEPQKARIRQTLEGLRGE